MATDNWSWYGNTVQHWRCRIDVTRTTTTGSSTATVTVKCYWESIAWGYQVYGQTGSAACDNVSSGQKTFNAVSASGASASVLVATASKTFTRRTTAYNINAGGQVILNGGYHNGNSTINHNVVIPALDVTLPGAPTNVVAKRNEDADIDITWTLTPPSAGSISQNAIEVAQNDGAWSSISNSLAASATSYNYTLGEPNSKYAFRVRSYTTAGWGGYGNSNVVYTTPAAPQQGYAYQKGDLINASIITANINYPDTYEWQISPDGTDNSWTTLDLDTRTTVIEDYQTEYDEPWFRVRCFSPLVAIAGETLPAVVSDWCTPFQASKRYEIYVNIPEGTTPQAIYVNVPDGTDSFDVLFRI